MNDEAAKALAAAPTEPTLEKPLRRVRYRGRNARHFREKYKETQFTASPPNWRQHMAAWPYVGEWLCAFDKAQVMVAARHVRQLHAHSTPRSQPRLPTAKRLAVPVN